jgi:non-specific serine/threonine protein kinase
MQDEDEAVTPDASLRRTLDLPPLPVPITQPVGRDDELTRIPRWLADSERCVALTGAPGAGKTRLALHVGQEVQRLTNWPALFLSLIAVDDPGLIAGMIAIALSLGEDGGTTIDRVQRRLNQTGPMLLILDNLEHLPGADAVIAELVRGCPDLRVLATSRQSLSVPGVRQFDVQPLPAPGPEAGREALRASPAVQLFAMLAGRAHFTVTDADLPQIGRICAGLDGLPLAIELAAAKAASLGLDTLAERLNNRRQVLDLSDGATDPRHHSLRSAIAWSYELLEPEAQVALNRLSVFSGGFSQSAVERMLGGSPVLRRYSPNRSHEFEWVERDFTQISASVQIRPLSIESRIALERLLDANWIQVSAGADGRPRYQMLESIRDFGLEQLRATGEYGHVRTAHAVAMLQFMDMAGYELWYTAGADSFREQRVEEQGNLRLALGWACDPANDLAMLAGRLICSSWFHFQLSGQISEGRMWLERVLALPNAPLWSRLQVMNALSFSSWTQGDADRADQLSQAVIREWGRSAPYQWLGIAHFNAGLVAWRRGDFAAMTSSLLTGKQILHDAGDLNGEGFCNLALGVLARFSGQYDDARQLFDGALALHTQAQHEWGAATSRYLAGEAARDEGNIPGAAGLIADGLRRYRDQSDIFGSGACVAALAVFAAERHELARAARLFGAAFAMCEYAGVLLPPVDLERYQQTAAAVATQVPASEFQRGRSWSIERATDEALAVAADVQAGRVPGPIDDPLRTILTADQRDAVNLLCDGLSVDEIATRLFRDPNTIYDRLARARQRLGVSSNRKLVSAVTALRAGLGTTDGS